MADTSSALSTTEAVLLDGANGVTNAPRQHFPHGMWFVVAALVIAVVVRVVKRPAVVAVLLGLAAVPGFVHVLALRADAPLRRGGSVEPIARTLSELHAAAPWPATPVKVTREDDELFPLGRYAFPNRVEVVGTPLEVELRGGPIGAQPCRQEHVRITCGSAP